MRPLLTPEQREGMSRWLSLLCAREREAIEVYAMLDTVTRGPIDTLVAWLRATP